MYGDPKVGDPVATTVTVLDPYVQPQAAVLYPLVVGALREYAAKDREYNGVWREASAVEQIALAHHKLRRIDSLIRAGAPLERLNLEAVDGLNYLAFGLRQIPNFRT